MNKLLAFFSSALFFSCSHPESKPDWQNKDLQKDGRFGISTDIAYDQLLRDKKASGIIVAVIDSGIDTTEEDLHQVLWSDPTDGSHGRNFIVELKGKEDFIYQLEHKKNEPGYERTLADYNLHITRLQNFISQTKQSENILKELPDHIGKKDPTLDDLRMYNPRNEAERWMLGLLLQRMPAYPDFSSLKFAEVDNLLIAANHHLSHGLKLELPDSENGDSMSDSNISNDPAGLVPDPLYGAYHGTYISGIIAAVRNNGKGINGIADSAKIMTLKLSGGIREMRNTDLAIAIRYAADHGAKIINMSFGKTFSVHRESVDSAVKYAMSKGLLIIHSAGNDRMNLDIGGNTFYPSPIYLDGGTAAAWITVGASGFRDDSTLAASFSNYGQHSVDVFAPGVQITSTIPFGGTITWDGTSQAAAVVAGLASLIWSYYPNLTAFQIKDIILRSVVRREVLKNKCITGGVVNAFNALQLAARNY